MHDIQAYILAYKQVPNSLCMSHTNDQTCDTTQETTISIPFSPSCWCLLYLCSWSSGILTKVGWANTLLKKSKDMHV